MTRLLRSPWFWLALVALLYVGVSEYRIAAADRRAAAIEQRIEDAKLDQLQSARDSLIEDRRILQMDRARLQETINGARATAAKVEAQARALNAATARVEAEGRRLVESGTVDDVVKAGRALGVSPIPMRRPK